MKGTNVYFESRVPSKWEMQNCRIVTMTDDAPWDPANITIAAVSPADVTDRYGHTG